MLRMESSAAGLILADSRYSYLLNVGLCLEIEGASVPMQIGPDGSVWQDEAGNWQARLTVSEISPSMLAVQMHLRATGAARYLDGFYLEVRGHNDHFPANGSRALIVCSPDMIHERVAVLDGAGQDNDEELLSRFATVVIDADSRSAMLAGIGGPTSDFSLFTVREGVLRAGCEVGRPVDEVTFPLVVGIGDDPLLLLEEYGDYLRDAAACRPGPVPVGWNTWDYYMGAVSMDDLRQEMQAIRESPFGDRVEYITIDMGWENQWGDWRMNRKFPSSFREVADEIKGYGFTPGIWVAPLQVSVYAPLARHRPDLLVHDADGQMVVSNVSPFGLMAMLDLTLPEVQKHLHYLFSSMREAGFSLFKIDYLYPDYINLMPSPSDGSTGKAGVIRKCLEVIREAIGDDAHMVGCGVPPECALGLVDSNRATTDIHNFWGHIRHNTRQLAVRYWMNGRLWVNDPDFAIVRSTATSSDLHLNGYYKRRPLLDYDDFWMAGPEATQDELKVWLTMVYLSAGSVFFSDSFCRLNDKGMETLGRLLPGLPEPARPVDLFENDPPRFWSADCEHGRVLGIFNWDDVDCRLEIPAHLRISGTATDFWTGEKMEIPGEVSLPPRSVRLLVLDS